MMMEQQTTLTIDYTQQKWKDCIKFTCWVYRETEWIVDLLRKCVSIIEEFTERIKVDCRCATECLSEVFKELSDILYEVRKVEYDESFPQRHPRRSSYSVTNFKVNTKGFPKPLLRCARSRC